MPFFHDRKSIRLKELDYSQPGYYFITINTFKREKLFGNLSDGNMTLSRIGLVVEAEWKKLPFRFKGLELDTHSTMPDHFHGAFFLHEIEAGEAVKFEAFSHPLKGTVPTIIRSFKSSVSVRIHQIVGQDIEIWQRNYYEEFIEDEKRLEQIREYIDGNHAKG
ncbi:MAG: transposase [Anaerolineaceae bacterium]